MNESDFLALLRPLAMHPAARGFADDAAVLGDLVLTHDMIVEGVHFRADDPPGDVAWKLVAVNLSDLAAKGATPTAALMGYSLSGEAAWDAAFVAGLAEALSAFDLPLLGGDTVSLPPGSPRVLGLTTFGRSRHAPSRSGAKPDDALWVTGTIGLAGMGLRCEGSEEAIAAYRRPRPRLAEGRALAPLVHAMMDVSDGLLLDASRMAEASGLALEIAIDAIPVAGERLAAVTAGDDYELLFALPDGTAAPVAATSIGRFSDGSGLTLTDGGVPVPLPARLGYIHD
ncbi:MAG: thiamine-phosphate kinase [Sphingomonadaceae bacterium]|nr:thiamine-phosphate kinase [Sphingomonadaceae bacterium]